MPGLDLSRGRRRRHHPFGGPGLGPAGSGLRPGGALETVVPLDDYPEGRKDFFSGVFFQEQTETSLIEAVERLEQHAHLLNPAKIRAHALAI